MAPTDRVRLSVRLRKDLHDKLEVVASLRGLSINTLINEAVEEYIAKREAENREALLKVRQYLEELRKLQAQETQASGPVNKADGTGKGVVGVKNENDKTVASSDPDFLNFVKGHNGMKLSFDEIYSVFLDREKTRRFVIWCVDNGYCEVVKEGNTQKYRVIDRG